MVTVWPVINRVVASRAQIIAGTSYSLAAVGPWAIVEPVSVIRPPAVRKVESSRGRWSGQPVCRRVRFVLRRVVDDADGSGGGGGRGWYSDQLIIITVRITRVLIRQGLRHLLNPVADSEGSAPGRCQADKGTKCPGNRSRR